MSYYGFFNDTAYRVVDGNIVYAGDINNPLAALETGIAGLVDGIQTGAVVKTATDTGALNAYVVNLTAAPATLVDGLEVWLKPAASNTGPATINVNSLGATAIRTTSQTALIGGELLINQWFLLKYSSAVSAFIIVSDPGITSYVGGDTLISGDGIGISTVDDEITIEVAAGEVVTAMLADDAVTAVKMEPHVTSRTIIGGDIHISDPSHPLTAAPVMSSHFQCWDSTGTVWLDTSTGSSIGIHNIHTPTADTLYKLYVVRKISDGECYLYGYDSEGDQADADATINAYRLVDFWKYGTDRWAQGVSRGGVHMWGKASEAILSGGIGASYAVLVNAYTGIVPVELIAAIEYGCKDAAAAGSILVSLDGTNVAFTVGLTITTATDTTLTAWGDTTSNRQGLVPYSPQYQFKASTGTLDLLVHQVLLRR